MFSPNNICLLLSLWLSVFGYVLSAVPQALSEAFDSTFVLTPVFGTKNVLDSSNVAAKDITASPTFNLVGQFDPSTSFTIFLMDVTGFQDPTVQAKLIYLQSGFTASKNDGGLLTSTAKTEVPYIAPTRAGRSIIALLFIEPTSGTKLMGFSSQGTFSVDRFRAANQFQLADAGSSFSVTAGTSGTNSASPQSEAPTSSPAVLESSIVSLTSSAVRASSVKSITPVLPSPETTVSSKTEAPSPIPTTTEEFTSTNSAPGTITSTRVSLPMATTTSVMNESSLTRSKLLSSISSAFVSTKSQPQISGNRDPSPTQSHAASHTTLISRSSVSNVYDFFTSSSMPQSSAFTRSTVRGSSSVQSTMNAPIATNAAHQNKKLEEKAQLIAGILIGLLLDV